MFPNIGHEMLRMALSCFYGDIDKASNYILDSTHPNNEQESTHQNSHENMVVNVAQGMLILSTALQSTSITLMDVIDLSNLPEATADASTNAAPTTATAMANTFYSNSSIINDTSEEGSSKTHLSDDEMKALVNKQYDDQLIKAEKSSFSKLRKKTSGAKQVNNLLDGYPEGFDLHLKCIPKQNSKGMTIFYNKKKMEIVHFYVDDNNETIDIWAKPINVKNAKQRN
eukprot:12745978-Ditylum_brightwellii.AAC.1